MALNLEGATIGFDVDQISVALDKLNEVVIEETANKMRKEEEDVEKVLRTAWVGQSANIFMDNMSTDRKNVVKALQAARTVLNNELYNIASRMVELDQGLVQRRSEK